VRTARIHPLPRPSGGSARRANGRARGDPRSPARTRAAFALRLGGPRSARPRLTGMDNSVGGRGSCRAGGIENENFSGRAALLRGLGGRAAGEPLASRGCRGPTESGPPKWNGASRPHDRNAALRAARPPGREHDDDLHERPEPRVGWGVKPGGLAVEALMKPPRRERVLFGPGPDVLRRSVYPGRHRPGTPPKPGVSGELHPRQLPTPP